MSVLERAAAALCAKIEGRDDVWQDLGTSDRRGYEDMARVVLMEVRIPESEIVEAGMFAGGFSAMADVSFTAMIDAILSEEMK